MKQLTVIALLLTTVTFFGYSQGSKVSSASIAINSFHTQKDASLLVNATKDIEAAAVHEKSGMQGKTWFVRAKLYHTIYAYRSAYPVLQEKFTNKDLVEKVYGSVEKNKELNDPKFKNGKELVQIANQLPGMVYRIAYDYQLEEDFGNAYSNYLKTREANELAKALTSRYKVKPQPVEEGVMTNDEVAQNALLNAANAAIKADQIDNAIALMEEIKDAGTDNPSIYSLLASFYAEKEDEEKMLATLNEGLEKFPTDLDLRISELNYFLKQDKADEAIDKIKGAIELDPSNAQLHFVLGNAYERLGANHFERGEMEDGKTKFKLALEAYEKSIELEPKNAAEVYYNMGVIYTNEAVEYTKLSADLGISKEELAMAEEYDAKAKSLMEKALPNLEKAKELNPKDILPYIALKEIYARLGQYDKSKEMKQKIAELQGGE